MKTPISLAGSGCLTPSKSSSENARLFTSDISCITKDDLAKILCISVSYINKLISEGKIPYKKFGRSVRFSVSEIEVWLQNRSRP